MSNGAGLVIHCYYTRKVFLCIAAEWKRRKSSRGKFAEVLPIGGAGQARRHLLPSWEYLGRFFSIFRALPTAEVIKQPLGPSIGRYFPLGVAMGIDFYGEPLDWLLFSARCCGDLVGAVIDRPFVGFLHMRASDARPYDKDM